MKNNTTFSKNIKKGDLLVLTDDYTVDIDIDYSLFEVLEVASEKKVLVKDLIKRVFRHKDSTGYINISNLYKVELNAINMFKNYVINSTLACTDCISEEELLIGKQVYNLAKESKTIDELFEKVNTIEYIENEDFVYALNDYKDTLESLKYASFEEIMDMYAEDVIFKFREFDESKVDELELDLML